VDLNEIIRQWTSQTGLVLPPPTESELLHDVSHAIPDERGELMGRPAWISFMRMTLMPSPEVGLRSFQQLAVSRPTVHCKAFAFKVNSILTTDALEVQLQSQLLRVLCAPPVCIAPLPISCGAYLTPRADSTLPLPIRDVCTPNKLKYSPAKQLAEALPRIKAKEVTSMMYMHDLMQMLEVDNDVLSFRAAQSKPVHVTYQAIRMKCMAARFADISPTAVKYLSGQRALGELEQLADLYAQLRPIPQGEFISKEVRHQFRRLDYDVAAFIMMTLRQMTMEELRAYYALVLTEFEPETLDVGVHKLVRFVEEAFKLRTLAGPWHFMAITTKELQTLPDTLNRVLDRTQMDDVLDLADRLVHSLPQDERDYLALDGLRDKRGGTVRAVAKAFDLRCLFEKGYFSELLDLLEAHLACESTYDQVPPQCVPEEPRETSELQDNGGDDAAGAVVGSSEDATSSTSVPASYADKMLIMVEEAIENLERARECTTDLLSRQTSMRLQF